MECDLEIRRALERFNSCKVVEGAFRVSTSCLYSDGSLVTLLIYKSKNGYRVTDDAGAIDTLNSIGISTSNSHSKMAVKIAKQYEVEFDSKLMRFFSPEIDENLIGSAIVYLANAVQKFVIEAVEKRELEEENTLRDRIAFYLLNCKDLPKEKIATDYILHGDSTKTYQFANALLLTNQTILIDAVTNHHASMAPTYMKFSDVSKSHPEYYREIVFEKGEEWSSSDLSAVSSVATHINDIADKLEPMFRRYGISSV